MVNKKEFKGYICEITGKPIRKMKLMMKCRKIVSINC